MAMLADYQYMRLLKRCLEASERLQKSHLNRIFPEPLSQCRTKLPRLTPKKSEATI